MGTDESTTESARSARARERLSTLGFRVVGGYGVCERQASLAPEPAGDRSRRFRDWAVGQSGCLTVRTERWPDGDTRTVTLSTRGETA